MTDIKAVSKTFTKAQKELIINTLKQNDDYTRNFSHHKESV